MKASEVLRRYKEGERNFRGVNFRGQDLSGVDFSYADIRSADFTGANLRGANFTGAQTGLQRRWTIFLVMISWLLSGLSGFFFWFNGILISLILDFSKIENQVAGWAALIVTIIIFAIIIRQGIGAIAVVVAIAFAGAFAFVFAVAGPFDFAFAFAGAFAIAGAFAGAVAFAFAIAVARPFAFAFAGAFTIALAATRAFPGAILIAVAGATISIYIAWQSMKGDEKYTLVRKIAIAFAAFGGTTFHNANLTDADFTGATLKNADFRNAKLMRTRFYSTKKLDFARVGNSILSNRSVLNLLVTGNGKKKSYVGLNLKGANLIGADLKKVNLKDADITGATFQGACLEEANLTLAQAVEANFTNALMTGACVEAWNIKNTTKLDNVDCRFVYLLENSKPGTDNRERRPSSGEFAPGEFTKLFQKALETVDLIFADGIDWKAFLKSFQELQTQYGDVAVQAIEKKSGDSFVVRLEVPQEANKAEIERQAKQLYEVEINRLEEIYRERLKAKDGEIEIYRHQNTELLEIIKLKASQPIKVEAKAVAGDDIRQSGNFGIGVNKGEVNTEKIAGTINEAQKQTLAETAAEIQALLEQLDKTHSTDTTTGKMALATEAIAQIDSNPTLTARILSALKVGSVKAFEQFLSHPAASFVIGALEDWQKTKGS